MQTSFTIKKDLHTSVIKKKKNEPLSITHGLLLQLQILRSSPQLAVPLGYIVRLNTCSEVLLSFNIKLLTIYFALHLCFYFFVNREWNVYIFHVNSTSRLTSISLYLRLFLSFKLCMYVSVMPWCIMHTSNFQSNVFPLNKILVAATSFLNILRRLWHDSNYNTFITHSKKFG